MSKLILTILGMLLFLSVSVNAQSLTISLNPSTPVVNETVQVLVEAEGLTDVIGYGVILDYDESKLEFVSAVENTINQTNVITFSSALSIPYNDGDTAQFSKKIAGEVPPSYTAEGDGALAMFTFRIKSQEPSEIKLIGSVGAVTGSKWQKKGGDLFPFSNQSLTVTTADIEDPERVCVPDWQPSLFGICSSEFKQERDFIDLNNCGKSETKPSKEERFCGFSKVINENKTKVSLRNDRNLTIEVKNIVVKEVIEKEKSDEPSKTEKLELRVESTGTQEVKIEVFDFGKPEKVLVDGTEISFEFSSGIVSFTTLFSERIITLDYTEPVPAPSPAPSGGGGSSGGGGGKRITTPKVTCEEVKIINKNDLCKEICEGDLEDYPEYVITESCAVNPLLIEKDRTPAKVEFNLTDEKEEKEPEPQKEPEKKKNTALRVFIFIVIILVGIAVLIGRKKEEKPKNNKKKSNGGD